MVRLVTVAVGVCLLVALVGHVICAVWLTGLLSTLKDEPGLPAMCSIMQYISILSIPFYCCVPSCLKRRDGECCDCLDWSSLAVLMLVIIFLSGGIATILAACVMSSSFVDGINEDAVPKGVYDLAPLVRIWSVYICAGVYGILSVLALYSLGVACSRTDREERKEICKSCLLGCFEVAIEGMDTGALLG